MSGFLTPDNPPNNKQFVRRIVLPADSSWTAVFDGLLLDLTRPWNWTAFGEMTPDEVAEWFNAHYDEFTTNFSEAPEYDTPDNADGEPIQPWYEALEDWIIAGFLAITFTPQAALVYQTTVPKIRVALRTGNLGALFKVLINGVEVWTGDSYAPIVDFIEQTFDNPTPGSACTVRVVHDGQSESVIGAAKLEYLREGVVADMVATILRADPEGCGVQWSTDNGGTWETVDLAACISSIATQEAIQAIQDAIANGQIAVPSQPGSGTAPDEGFCATYHVNLHGNDRWLAPIPVKDGYTVEVSNVVGAWWDGDNLSTAWYCGDGNRQLLGACSAIGAHTNEGDPLNTALHMSLIGNIAETYFDPFSLYTIPPGIPETPLYLMANDSQLYDNQGAIEFDVTICNYAPVGGCHIYDFTVSNQGWIGYSGTTWQTFGGINQWGSAQNYNLSSGGIDVTQNATITGIRVDYGTYGPRSFSFQLYDNTAAEIAYSATLESGHAEYVENWPLIPGHQYSLNFYANDARGLTISKILVRGNNIGDFGEDNC